MLEEGTRWNWFSGRNITTCAWVAGIALIMFVARSLTYRNPVVDLRALGNRNFALGHPAVVHHRGGHLHHHLPDAAVPGLCPRLQRLADRHRDCTTTGIASLLGTPVYIVLARKFDVRWLMMFGLACFGLSMWSFSFITHDWGAAELLVPQVLRGFPQVFAVAPSVNLGLGSLPPERLKYASGLFNIVRNLGGAVGIAASAAIINDSTNLHFQYIAGRPTPANGAVQRFVQATSERYGAMPGGAVVGHQAALEQLWNLAYREASTLSVRRRVPRHHAWRSVPSRDAAGAADAQGGGTQGTGRGCALRAVLQLNALTSCLRRPVSTTCPSSQQI